VSSRLVAAETQRNLLWRPERFPETHTSKHLVCVLRRLAGSGACIGRLGRRARIGDTHGSYRQVVPSHRHRTPEWARSSSHSSPRGVNCFRHGHGSQRTGSCNPYPLDDTGTRVDRLECHGDAQAALIEAARRKAAAAIRAEAEQLAADEADRAEAVQVLRDMEALRAW
jgi:hypothetical protein